MSADTTDTAVTLVPITRQDLATLKHADSVTFRLWQGRTTIEANKDEGDDGFSQKRTIYVNGSVIDYSKDVSFVERQNLGTYVGFHMEQSNPYKFNEEFRTIINRIRVGDSLRLRWIRGNNNENNDEIRWNRDELVLVITHPKGPTPEAYLVDVQVGPNNSARMVRLSSDVR